jgi:hypothetical protein
MPILFRFFGRGVFNYDFGLLPFRTPVLTVVGAPIPCPKSPNPSQKLVKKYHLKYLQGLQKLYDEYNPNPNRKLKLVE